MALFQMSEDTNVGTFEFGGCKRWQAAQKDSHLEFNLLKKSENVSVFFIFFHLFFFFLVSVNSFATQRGHV